MDLFITMLIVQLFFGTGLTILLYSLPADSIKYLASYESLYNRMDMENISEKIETTTQSTTNVPLAEVGALVSLVFYSGNIILDLLLNFFFAIPIMLGLLTEGICLLFNLDGAFVNIIQVFVSVVVGTMYMVGLLQFIASMRSGQNII